MGRHRYSTPYPYHNPYPQGMPPYDPRDYYNYRFMQSILSIAVIVIVFFVVGAWLQKNYGLKSNPYNVTRDSLGINDVTKTKVPDSPKDDTTQSSIYTPEVDVGGDDEGTQFTMKEPEPIAAEEESPMLNPIRQFFFQASAHAEATLAFDAKNKWEQKNFSSFVEPIPNHPQHLLGVLVGPFASARDAQSYQNGINRIFERIGDKFEEIVP